jgi:hypothetical protein
MQKSLGGQIVIPSQSPSVIPIVAPSSSDGGEQQPVEQKMTKVVLKPPLKGWFSFLSSFNFSIY